MGSPRFALASVALNGFIYVMGGYGAAEKYDPATDRWTPIASMGSVREGLTAVAL